jgi:hypothetical protein
VAVVLMLETRTVDPEPIVCAAAGSVMPARADVAASHIAAWETDRKSCPLNGFPSRVVTGISFPEPKDG